MWIPLIDNKRYPIKTRLWLQREDRVSIAHDRLAIKKDKSGKEFWRLKFAKGNRNVKPYWNSLLETRKGMFIDLYSPTRGDYYPVTFNQGELEVVDEDMKFWHIMERDRAERRWQKHESVWSKYYPVILVVMLGFAFMLMFIGYGEFFKEASGPMQGVANSLQSAAQALRDAAGQTSIKPPF